MQVLIACARPSRALFTHCGSASSGRAIETIGRIFGGRDHTTVMHGVRVIAELREADPEIAQDYEKLLILIQN